MPPTQLSLNNLNGYRSFTKVITEGKRFEKTPIRVFVRLTTTNTSSLNVGFTVTKKTRKAAHRNRIKRLMREAFRASKQEFTKLVVSGKRVEIVFMYKSNTDIAPARVRFSSINEAFLKLSQAMILNGTNI
jgi:ribonuclease P protein component